MKLLSYADVHAQLVFTLEDGRPVLVDELVQYRTYRNLLLGLPGERQTIGVVEGAKTYAQKLFGDNPEPYVFPFELLDYEQAVGQSKLSKDGSLTQVDVDRQVQKGKRLPLVTCIASLQCPVTVKPPEGTGVFSKSIARVVWFQEKFGPPKDEHLLQRFRNLDWQALATDISD